MSSDGTVWVEIDRKLKYLAPVFLLLLIIYLYSSIISPLVPKQVLQYVEIAIIVYFLFELVVKYAISDSYRQFLHDYWFDIILLVPFFKSLKLLGAVGTALKSIKGLVYIKYVRKAIKIPKMVRKTWTSSEKTKTETDSSEEKPD